MATTTPSRIIKLAYHNGDRKHDEDWRLRLRHALQPYADICIFAEMGKWRINWEKFESSELDAVVGPVHLHRGMQTLKRKEAFQNETPFVESKRFPDTAPYCERHKIEFQYFQLKIGKIMFQVIAVYHTGHTDKKKDDEETCSNDDDSKEDSPETFLLTTKEGQAGGPRSNKDGLPIDFVELVSDRKPVESPNGKKKGGVVKACCEGVVNAVLEVMNEEADYVIFFGDVNLPKFVEKPMKKTRGLNLTERFELHAFQRTGIFGTHFQPKKGDVRKEDGDFIVESSQTDVIYVWSKTGDINPAHIHIHNALDGFPFVRKEGEEDLKDKRHGVLLFELGEALPYSSLECVVNECDPLRTGCSVFREALQKDLLQAEAQNEKENMALEIKDLQMALPTANDKIDDAAIVNDLSTVSEHDQDQIVPLLDISAELENIHL